MSKLGIGLHGTSGHQVQAKLVDHPKARLVAVSRFDREKLPEALQGDNEIAHYDDLDAMLSDDRVQLVSLCSPRRRDQPHEAIRCLEAGRHVFAEKPCAFTEEELDAIMATAARTGRQFHEMAGTVFAQPYAAMRKVVQAGEIGEVAQIYAQKSYPYRDRRPQDEDVDGGLTMQAGVHALRFIEHITGIKVDTIAAQETQLGNPKPGELRMASAMMMRLQNDGLATAIANYFRPEGFEDSWGYEVVRIFGTRGMVECSAAGGRTRLIVGETDRGALDTSEKPPHYFDSYLDALHGGPAMPLSLEDELHPTRMVIRARASAQAD